MATERDTWLGKTEAATRANVSVRTIERWLSTGLLARYRAGPTRRLCISADELDKLIEPRRDAG